MTDRLARLEILRLSPEYREAVLNDLDAIQQQLAGTEKALRGYYGTHNYTRLDTGQKVACACRLCQSALAVLDSGPPFGVSPRIFRKEKEK